MADNIQLTDAVLLLNNEKLGFVPNTLKFNLGRGEQTQLVVSEGEGQVSLVFSDNVESKIGMVKFDMRTTNDNIELTDEAKLRGNDNTLQLILKGSETTRNYTFRQAALTSPIEYGVGADVVIPIEVASLPAT